MLDLVAECLLWRFPAIPVVWSPDKDRDAVSNDDIDAAAVAAAARDGSAHCKGKNTNDGTSKTMKNVIMNVYNAFHLTAVSLLLLHPQHCSTV